MAALLPPRTLGRASIEHVESAEGKVAYLFVVTDSGKRQLMMTDIAFDRMTTQEVVERAHGDVLIIGLGLGLILHPILAKPDVRRLTVIEKYEDVITLIAPSLPASEKLHIIVADGCSWLPPEGSLYDVIWIDTIGSMEPMRERFAPYLAPGPDSWLETWERTEQIRTTGEK